MIVMKFGGSSLESAAAIDSVAGIVKGALVRKPIVVVSAMGKTTQQLLTIGEEAAGGKKDRALERLQALREMHEREIETLIPTSGRSELRQILDGHFATGDTVKVVTPGGAREFEILKLTTIHDDVTG